MQIDDRTKMETHLALQGWVPYNWCRGGAFRGELIAWIGYSNTDNEREVCWSKTITFRIVPGDEELDFSWSSMEAKDFWKLAHALEEL